MKRIILFLLPVIIMCACIKDRIPPVATSVVVSLSDTVMYYWSFNTVGADTNDHKADYGVTSSGTFNYWAAYIDTTAGSIIDLLAGAPLSDTGTCLRLRNPSDSIVFYMPTKGYDSVVFQYAVQASGSGPTINYIHYTTDGVHYITNPNITSSFNNITTAFVGEAIDFSADPATSNNPNFAVSIVLGNNNTGTSGNDRFDNVTLLGKRQ